MASVRDNLIAAKALIDTPEKMAARSPLVAIGKACDGEANKGHAVAFVGQALLRWSGMEPKCFADMAVLDHMFHADIMALFDRAIAAQPA